MRGAEIFAGAVAALVLAACNGPEKLILPGKVDLAVAFGDRLRLCPEDGLDDTTPEADCVLGAEKNPLAPYAKALEAKGWTEDAADALREVWTLSDGVGCKRLLIDGGRDAFARKGNTLLRFELVACPL